MVRRWSTTRSWLVVWELLALVALGIAVNRYFRAAPVSYDDGVGPMSWETLMSMVRAAFAAAVCAVVGLVPAAWFALGPAGGHRATVDPSPGSPGAASQPDASMSA